MSTPRVGTAAEKAESAPHPDADFKPDELNDIKGPSWVYTTKKAFSEFTRDQCTDLAAGLTYYSVLSVFPALLAIVSLLGVVGQADQTTTAVLDLIRQLGQGDVADQIEGPVRRLTEVEGAGIGLVVGLAGALWSASGYVGAFGRALNRVYQVDEGRPFWKLRPANLLLTAVLVLMAVLLLLGLVLSGDIAGVVGRRIGLESGTVDIFNIAKWPVMLAVVVLMVALLYHFTPNIRQPKLRWMSPGAALALVVILVASFGFALYVRNFGSYDKTYGSLAGVIIALLWIWIVNNVLLLGAEFDSELERSRQLQAGIPAEETLQLPPRDTAASEKAQEKLEDQVSEGRKLRLEADPTESVARRLGLPTSSDGGAAADGSSRRARGLRPTVGAGDHRVRDDAPEQSDTASNIGGLLAIPTIIWAIVRGVQRGN